MAKYTLDQTFTHKTDTHEFQIQWTRIGDTNSPPLIFIHGTPWSNVVWHDLASALSSRYSVYLYDHPGFGKSPRPRRLIEAADQRKIDLDGSLRLRAEASAALIEHWNLHTSPHVVAHDNAGLVSLRLLLEHEIKFSSLCLIDVVALGPFGLPFFKTVAENDATFKAIPAHLLGGFGKAYIENAVCKPLPKEIEDLLCAPWLEGGTQGPARFLDEMIQAHNRETGAIEDGYGRVGSLVPTKIIWGKDDAWIPCSKAYDLQKALKAEEVVLIEEAGHLVHYDQPSKLALELGLWLEKHKHNAKR